jgi:alpha-galactosidase
MRIADWDEPLRTHAGPGHWNDPDIPEVGNGMTESEDRFHFSLWCKMAAPLMAGNDLSKMNAATKAILCNREVIAVDQDSLSVQGFRYSSENGVEAWFKPLEKGSWAACFVNRGDKDAALSWDWAKRPVKDGLSGRELAFEEVAYKVRDFWRRKDWGATSAVLRTTLKAHDVVMLRLER